VRIATRRRNAAGRRLTRLGRRLSSQSRSACSPSIERLTALNEVLRETNESMREGQLQDVCIERDKLHKENIRLKQTNASLHQRVRQLKAERDEVEEMLDEMPALRNWFSAPMGLIRPPRGR